MQKEEARFGSRHIQPDPALDGFGLGGLQSFQQSLTHKKVGN